jgi:uncharacterized protein (TIGR02594 family)
MPTLLEVMQSRIGIAEIRGSKHNPLIVGWAKAIGHAEVVDDETSWCAICCGSAALEADLPMPPHNVRMLARSWLTWGVKVERKDLAPGDVAVWPRGDPKGWQGHINIVETVNPNGTIVCIGGNQSTGKGYDAVTRTKPVDPKGALGFRRAVPATVKDLRKAGSTTIKAADNLEKAGIFAAFLAPIVKGVEMVFGKVDVPQFAALPEGLTWWQSVLGGANAVANYAIAHPYLAATLIVGLGAWTISRRNKASRVAEHAAGIPIAAEVAKLESA